MEFDVYKIRKDFPLLAPPAGGPVYFDSACMALKPEPVIKAIESYYREYPACSGRSNHRMGEMVSRKIAEARKIIADFINALPEEIIFTRNTTEGINLIARSFDFRKGDAVLISDKEHNSNLIPWQIAKIEKEIELEIIPSKKDNTFDLAGLDKWLGPKVKLVSVVFTSNLDGATNPIKEIIKKCHQNNSLVLVDAAQTAGHQKINVKDLVCDFLAFSGHKMLGPTGTGILYVRKNIMEKLRPFMVGGGAMEDSTYEDHKFLAGPERFEAGLQDYAGIIGLGEAVKYLKNVGFENIKEREKKINQIISAGLKNLPEIQIIGPLESNLRGSIVNFFHPKLPSHEIAILLDRTYNIMTRSGRHCVHSWYNSRRVKDSVRASFYFYNTEAEAEYFVDSLEKIIKLV